MIAGASWAVSAGKALLRKTGALAGGCFFLWFVIMVGSSFIPRRTRTEFRASARSCHARLLTGSH